LPELPRGAKAFSSPPLNLREIWVPIGALFKRLAKNPRNFFLPYVKENQFDAVEKQTVRQISHPFDFSKHRAVIRTTVDRLQGPLSFLEAKYLRAYWKQKRIEAP